MHRRLAAATLTLALCMLTSPATPLQAQTTQLDELKATFIYSFVRYSEWPEKPAEIRIAFFGPHSIYANLSRMIANRSAQATPRYRLCDTDTCIANANAIFIGRNDPLIRDLPRLARLKALTISDMPGFLEAGGMVEIHRQGDRFIFRVSLKNAMKQDIYINPEMLEFADEVDR